MRKTLIIGTVMALVGFATAVQAGDHRRSSVRDEAQVARTAAHDSRDDHERYEHSDRSRERHHESRKHEHDSREGHDESKEHDGRR